MAEVLPVLSRLPKVFQTEDLPFGSVSPALKCTLQGIETCNDHGIADWEKEVTSWQQTHIELSVQRGDPAHFLDSFTTPYLQTLLCSLTTVSRAIPSTVLKAAEVFNQTKCPQTQEDRYHYGHYSIETTTTLSEVISLSWTLVAALMTSFYN